MKDFKVQYPQRECRVFWVEHDYKARQMQGFRCSPDVVGFWWFPEIGYSVGAFFATEQEAWQSVFAKIEVELKALMEAKARAEKALKKAGCV